MTLGLSDTGELAREHASSLRGNLAMRDICKLSYRCSFRWSELKPGPDAGKRFCGECQTDVFRVTEPSEAAAAARQGLCVAFDQDDEEMMGVPLRLTAD